MGRLGDVLARTILRWGSGAAATIPQPFPQRFLHVGCGRARREEVAPGFRSTDWQEVRLDIDPAVAPDIVGSMLEMSSVPDGSFEGLFSSHNLEHLYPHEVPIALAEFRRVLKPDGIAVITCPDLQSVARLIADDRLDEPAYLSPAGPIAPMDIVYGHRPQLASGNLYMAHRGGFTLKTIVQAVREAGFRSVAGRRREDRLDLWLLACPSLLDVAAIESLVAVHFPE